ncbi:hypothetical protein PCANC_00007 [Puccinia coronata f. sp. avenae]|uniref:Uncharacterized protein n=1 Tax=Puccinia coronata f. sp. avenae TaxID=200324 RepID=A0A2N5W8F8_9BASI|nr:hypothetical protein PCANC_00007 [Puccinia coronata f. sp. avenae]
MPFKTLALITICLVASAISKPLPQSEDCTTDECLSLLLRGSIPPSVLSLLFWIKKPSGTTCYDGYTD